MKSRLPNSHRERIHSSGVCSSRARSEIIVSSLKKLSQLLGAYDPTTEITLCEGGCEISSMSLCEGAFMPFDDSSSQLMLCEQLERFEIEE